MTVATVDILWTGTMCANNQRPFGVEVIWDNPFDDKLIVITDDNQIWQVKRSTVKRDNEMATKATERPVDRVAKAVKLCQPSKAQAIVETALDRLLNQAHKVLDLRYAGGHLATDSATIAQLEVLAVLLQHFETDRLAWAESVLSIHGKG